MGLNTKKEAPFEASLVSISNWIREI